MAVQDLMRSEILELAGYEAPEIATEVVRLHANENPWRPEVDQFRESLNHYPPARPIELEQALAARYSVNIDNIMATRGSSDAIDLLVRAFCRPGKDAVVVCPPAFEMYSVYAQIQGAIIHSVPLNASAGFSLDVPTLLQAVADTTKIIFLCSPNNPTGNCIPIATLEQVAAELTERSILVIDEAYGEFTETQDCAALLRYENVVLLRTLSKALGLAGLRCGSMLASPDVVDIAKRITPPYAIPTPSIEFALRNLDEEALAVAEERIRLIRFERARLEAALHDLSQIAQVWPSQANFILARAHNPQDVWQAIRNAGLLIRVFEGGDLDGCLRITVGKPDENDRLLDALSRIE